MQFRAYIRPINFFMSALLIDSILECHITDFKKNRKSLKINYFTERAGFEKITYFLVVLSQKLLVFRKKIWLPTTKITIMT